MNNNRIINKNPRAVIVFVLLVYIFYGLELSKFVVIDFLGILNIFLRLNSFIVEYKNRNWLEYFVFLILTTSILISGYGIQKFKKWGLFSFLTFFILNFFAGILLLLKEISHACPLLILGIIISFITDVIFIIYFFVILKKYYNYFN